MITQKQAKEAFKNITPKDMAAIEKQFGKAGVARLHKLQGNSESNKVKRFDISTVQGQGVSAAKSYRDEITQRRERQILKIIKRFEPVTSRMLAKHSGLSSDYAAKIAKRLAARGLVTCEHSKLNGQFNRLMFRAVIGG